MGKIKRWRKANGGTENRVDKQICGRDGLNSLILPERGGAWSRVFLRATAGARHNLEKSGV